ncbi:MAG: septation ring formation regulator EzrA [Bacilli bacterium]|nr:septation ring formation regulator EzrA [Bacilli bacterium]MDD4608133.1 septation ring formation regulator EzrA [Bacilli bacterium]
MDGVTLISITLFFITVIMVVVVLNVIQNFKNNKIKKHIDELDIEKNKIDSAPIMPELAKIESFLKNEKLEVMYNEWKERLQYIKSAQIPKLTEMILEAEYSLSQMDYKGTLCKMAKLELEIYKVRTNSEFLMDEIKEITTSEEKNRAIITKLKITYRELFQKFTETRSEYGDIAKSISLQFENIAKRFEDFEHVMENNEYTEVTQIIKAIDEMLKHMSIVIEEIPAIVLLATNVLPSRIKEAEEIYKKMVNGGYPLDYLNIEYNISEADKKINDVMVRSRVLNLEDSLFELKVLLDYFDSLFNDFEKERINRQTYEETNISFAKKLNKINGLITDIFSQIEDIKTVYNLSKEDMDLLVSIREELKGLNADYKILIDHTSNDTFAYSKLIKEIEILVLKLASIEDRLDNSLDAISSMKEDEVRARQQLEEVKLLLKDSKTKIREYNLPVVPKTYYVELNEAQSAIREIVKELERKPITISVLNTRVDTARDLVLKLFTKTKEIMKTAMFAEMAIVYGNRYRSAIDGVDHHLTSSEMLFFRGEYQKSLELTINTLNKVEPGIYNKLLKLYGNEKTIN